MAFMSMATRAMFAQDHGIGKGRAVILTDKEQIDSGNILDVMSKAVPLFVSNAQDADILWKYYKGVTPIYNKTNEVRTDINNIICENRAMEITDFDNGFLLGEPIQYTKSGLKDGIDDDISMLNDIMRIDRKAANDVLLGQWTHVCGIGFKIILPDKSADRTKVMKTSILDPRSTFVIRYNNGLDLPMVAACTVILHDDNTETYNVYTDKMFYVIKDDKIVKAEANTIGMIPIVEYELNHQRMGCFETVIPLLDAINMLQSNRMDGVQEAVDSILVILGASIDEPLMEKLKEWRALSLPEGTDAKYVYPAMQQSDIQTLKDDLYQSVLTICGLPNRNGGSSTSDTGQAVELRDGWQSAETNAKNSEKMFQIGESQSLEITLRICRMSSKIGRALNIDATDVSAHFSRHHYDNLVSKCNVLTAMLNNDKINPETAYVASGMFVDPSAEYTKGMSWYKEQQSVQQSAQKVQTDDTSSLSKVSLPNS